MLITQDSPDDLLAAECAADNPAAWNELIRRFEPHVKDSIALLLGPNAYRHDQVDDVFQDVCCHLLEHGRRRLRDFNRARGRLETYLLIVARQAVNRFRRSTSCRAAGWEQALTAALEPADHRETPGEWLHLVVEVRAHLSPALDAHFLAILDGQPLPSTPANRQKDHRVRQVVVSVIDHSPAAEPQDNGKVNRIDKILNRGGVAYGSLVSEPVCPG